MKLQVSGWYVKLCSDINITININGRTPVCTFCNNLHLVHKHSVRRIAKYLAIMSICVDLPIGNQWLTTRGVVYIPNIENALIVT